jgi:predicted hydrocarbon binding protein
LKQTDGTLPKIIPLWYYEAGKTTFEILARIKNDPGSLATLLSCLSREEIDIVQSLSYSLEGTGVWIGFVRHKKSAPLTSQGLRGIVMSSPSTISCQIAESVDGMLIEDLAFPVTAASGDREIIIGAQFMQAMMEKLREEFQSAADVFLYREGVAFGEIAEARYIRLLGRERLMKSLKYVFQELYSAFGWARAELVSVNIEMRTATVRLYENFECPKSRSDKPCNHFIRGFVNGCFSVLMEAKTSTREVKCVSMGDEFCEFRTTGS